MRQICVTHVATVDPASKLSTWGADLSMSLRKASAIVAWIALAVIASVAGLYYATFGTVRAPTVAATDFVLPDVTIVTPRIERLSDQDVGIAGDKIEWVGPAASVLSPKSLQEFRGRYVLPGLFDMHMHFPPGNMLHLTEHALLLFLAHGVTGVRALGDLTGTSDPAARAALANGAPGPEMFTCGPFVAGTSALRWPNTIIVNRPEEADGIVDRIRAAGNVCVKAYEDLSREKLRALREATAKRGMAMPGHVPYGLDYVAGDVPEVTSTLKGDHLIERSFDWSSVDEARLDEVVQATLQNGTINLPTLVSTSQFLYFRDVAAARATPAAHLLPRLYRDVVWDPHDGIAIWRGVDRRISLIEDSHRKKLELTPRLFEAGAPLLIGTDAGQPFVPPGSVFSSKCANSRRLASPSRVWAIATWRAADMLGRSDLGRIRAGARVAHRVS